MHKLSFSVKDILPTWSTNKIVSEVSDCCRTRNINHQTKEGKKGYIKREMEMKMECMH